MIFFTVSRIQPYILEEREPLVTEFCSSEGLGDPLSLFTTKTMIANQCDEIRQEIKASG